MEVTFDIKEYKSKIVPIIKERRGVVSSGDIAIETGYPVIHTKYVLNLLAAEYLADIQVTENGDLIYKFDPTLAKNSLSFKDIMGKFFRWLYKIFVVLFKFSIMLTLIGYTIFYVLLIVALAVGLSASSKGKNNKSFDFVGATIRILFEMIIRFFIFYKSPYQKYDGVAQKRPFYIKVFSFVFGDDNKIEQFNHDKNILHYLKTNKIVTLAQAVNMTGMCEFDTRKTLLEMVVKYDGDVEVSEDGVIYYVFNNLTFTDETEKPTLHSWDRHIPIPKLNYNSKGDNIKIILLNSFNLLMSIFFTYFSYTNGEFIFEMDSAISIIRGIFIYGTAFSTLFFTIPLIRMIVLPSKVKKVKLLNSIFDKLKQIYNIALKNRDSIDLNKSEEELNIEIFSRYPSLMKRDFVEKEIIDFKIYTQEINFKVEENPKL
ncbi:hypothetical protein JXR93_00900 [bacterium]|nr:hypothetical protein [bacterium]